MKKKLNLWIEHSIENERHSTEVADKVISVLRQLYSEVSNYMMAYPYMSSKAIYNDVSKSINGSIKEYRQKLYSIYDEEIKNITESETVWIQDFMKELGKEFIIPASIISSIRFSPVANTVDYKTVIDNSVDKILQSADSSLRTAVYTKESMNSVTERFNNKESNLEQVAIKDSDAINKTAFSTISYLMFKANKQEVVYCSLLDSNVCSDCMKLHGKIFEYWKAPKLGLHYGCRCMLIPKELADNLPENFQSWVDTLSESEQKEVLGASRYKLYTKYHVPVTKFSIK